jgi:hypothetical protein
VPAEPRSPYQYAIIRVVPLVERGECLNAGVVLLCRSKAFIGARTELDAARLQALAPETDPAGIQRHLDAIERIARGDPDGGPIALLSIAERFHWLVSPASTSIQPSAVHTGLTGDPAAELEHLMDRLVR